MAKDKSAATVKDVCIIGGGPAGVATALMLKQRGIQSTIIEAAAVARPKVGETLPPSVLPILESLGAAHLLNIKHLPCYGNVWHWGSDVRQEKHFMFNTAGANGWHLQRQLFEKDLIGLAIEKGIEFIGNTKLLQATIHKNTGKWQLQVKKENNQTSIIESRFMVDATGRSSKFARCLGIGRSTKDTLTGIVANFILPHNTTLSQLTHIEATAHGWWYAAAISNNEMVTAFMTGSSLLQKNFLTMPVYWQAINQTKLISTLFPKGYVPSADALLHTQAAGTSFLHNIYGHNWLAVGDAAFAYDPISSYGIISALGSGCYAGNAIADFFNGFTEALPAYRFVLEKSFTAYLGLWQQQYKLEGRWPDSSFWKQRRNSSL